MWMCLNTSFEKGKQTSITFMKNGVIIINKEIGPTSQAVVNRVKRLLGASKAGHTGTLDPMATGVLPVLIERGVKASEFMLSSDKHYIATLLLGRTTDTEDVTGETLTESDNIPTEEEVIKTACGFVVAGHTNKFKAATIITYKPHQVNKDI